MIENVTLRRITIANATAGMVLAAADISDAMGVLRAVGTPEADAMADTLGQRRMDLLQERATLRAEHLAAIAPLILAEG